MFFALIWLKGLKARAIVSAPIHQPIAGFRMLKPLVRDSCVRRQRGRRRRKVCAAGTGRL